MQIVASFKECSEPGTTLPESDEAGWAAEWLTVALDAPPALAQKLPKVVSMQRMPLLPRCL